jgi:hypothetical protein
MGEPGIQTAFAQFARAIKLVFPNFVKLSRVAARKVGTEWPLGL